MHHIDGLRWSTVIGMGVIAALFWYLWGVRAHGRELWGADKNFGLILELGMMTGIFIALLYVAIFHRL